MEDKAEPVSLATSVHLWVLRQQVLGQKHVLESISYS